MDGSPATRTRLESVDVVRGVIMILMALDHTRDFFGMPGQNPTDLATATAPLFLTRWITNVCAPVFFLLTGTGAYLSLRRTSPSELSRFLFTRGLWLLFLEVVLLRCFAYQFNVDYRVTMLRVLWALGWAMITLSALVRLPVSVVTAIGVVMIGGHNLPAHWMPQKAAAFTVLSFLNTIKYPPSLLFLLMTLGPAMLLLWSVDRGTPSSLRVAP